MYNINEANELLDAIEILAEKSAKNNAVIYSGIVTEISTSVCTMKINGNTYSNIVYYGGTPIVGNAYRVFVPFGNMSQAFTLIFADTSPGESGVQSVNGKTGAVVLTANDVGAVSKTGDTITGSLGIGGDLTVSGKTNGLYIKAGTKVITTTENSQVAVFTSADLNTLFGTSGITWDNTNSVCFFSNGDWSANSIPICAIFYSGKWRIMTTDWSKFTSGASFRVNYIAIGWA